MQQDAERRRRAEARRGQAVLRRSTLHEPAQDLSPVRGEAALSLVTRLTAESYAEAGLEVPRYARVETPYRFVPRERRR